VAAKPSILDIDAQIEKLRERRKTLIVKSADRFARAATKSGLAEMEITDEEVDRIFEEIAARFRKAEKKGAARASSPPSGQPGGGSGATTEVPHDS
jgi:DNA invertase Pin-like site-specific DNA recombinase